MREERVLLALDEATILSGETRKAIRIPEPTRAWRSWHASIMPDSSTAATVFPAAARAASRTFSYLFSPTRLHEDPHFFLASFPEPDGIHGFRQLG